MIPAELSPEDEALLTAEGWTLVDGSAGDWRDPYTRDAVPGWRALELVAKDTGAPVVDIHRALKRLSETSDALAVTVLQLRLECQRKVARGEDTREAADKAMRATELLREAGRQVAALCAPRGS